jgi:hypothetical protein
MILLLYPAFPPTRQCRSQEQTACDPRGRRDRLVEKETILSKNSKDVMDRAEATFKKEERAREGAKAMRDYEAEGRAVREKTARLKLLRLAKEAEAAEKKTEPKKASRQSKIMPTP